jgi:hypothetical protein
MKPLGDSIRDRSYEITSTANAICYSLDKLTAAEALIVLEMVKQMVPLADYQRQVAEQLAACEAMQAKVGSPLTGSTTL